jgi:hypothetical protein
MARRKRRLRLSFRRIAALAVAIASIAAAGWFGYEHLLRRMPRSIGETFGPSHDVPRESEAPRRVEGALSASGPARDGQLGVSANAAVLFRHVEMYQWQEHCDGTCRYDQSWSAPVDSRRFREPKGHENPQAPFNDSVFFAPGVKLAGYTVDPDLLVAQLHASAYPAHDTNLPPNLAASFAERDGVLYAGGDPAHPAVGEVRVSYRVIATGPTTLNGVLRGGKLASH